MTASHIYLNGWKLVTDVDASGNHTLQFGGAISPITTPATYVDVSGTITTGSAAQTAAAVNTARRGMMLQNNSTGDLWFSTLATAVQAQPSIKIPSGQSFSATGADCPTGAISIIGATTGQAFSGRVW